MGAQKFKKKNGKTQNSISINCFVLDSSTTGIWYWWISKNLNWKNENNSAFKYDDQIDDISLDNADKIFIPEIDYSYSFF